MPAQRQVSPRRRRPVSEACRPFGRQPAGPEPMGSHSGQGFEIIGFAGEDRNGDGVKYFRPTAPLGHLEQIIRSHQPNEPGGGKLLPEPSNGIDRIAGAEPGFDGGDPNAGVAGDGTGRGRALRQRRHLIALFQRVSRRYQPPDGIELQALQSLAANIQVAVVRRIERSAEQADPLAAPAARHAFEIGHRQGRSCPAPRTMYL